MKKKNNKNYRLQLAIIAALVVITNLSFVSIVHPRSEIGHTEYVVVLGMKSIAILPFSDRSHQVFKAALDWNGNREVVNRINDCFESQEIPVVSGQTIERLLLSEGVIKPFKEQDSPASQEWSVIRSTYSPIVTKEILRSVFTTYETSTGLSRNRIKKLAKKLEVDAFVRGVILDATPKPLVDTTSIIERDIPDPFGGILPFKMEGSAYFSMADKYEEGLPPLSDYRPIALDFPEGIERALEVIIFIQNADTGAVVWSNSFKMPHPTVSKAFNIELGNKIKLAMDELFSVLYCYRGLWILVQEKEKD